MERNLDLSSGKMYQEHSPVIREKTSEQSLKRSAKIKDDHVSVPKPPKWRRAGKILGDGYSVAWRQLDAQFWGVPQRRKRIYLVADFAGWSAGKILFESEGVSGYSKEMVLCQEFGHI